MPFNQFTTRTTATGSAQNTLLTEGGKLQSVSAFPEDATIRHSWIYCELWLISTDTPDPTELALLAAGYIGKSSAIAWTGSIDLEPTYGIQCRMWCDDAHAVRTSVIVGSA